jgi:hypothetical protein
MTHGDVLSVVKTAAKFRQEYGTSGDYTDFAEILLGNDFPEDVYDDNEDFIGDLFDAAMA